MTIIEECRSTNEAIDRMAAHGEALMARVQTAGRGQRGNAWESEPYKNITMSIMLRPEQLPASRQFELSEAVALGVADLLVGLGIDGVRVKWPNDVYAGDRKICGILIENVVNGNNIGRSIAGIGLNVNQTEFLSGAPNPVSLKQLTGRDYDVCELGEKLVRCVLRRVGQDNHSEYRRRLWRGEGKWQWETAEGDVFEAGIEDVLADGRLVLSGCNRRFAFKEVRPRGFAN